ncbi:MAG TPA: 50S ribosomal protein L25 [Candidatus Latescibacteria bacterium]|nr:50S ribosomal protein L25 [Candidatus Aminicenantes bacterium]HUT08738.1 50S ribosomal protein L25 [Candidatus Latescibacterota bacterium]
MNVVIKSEQRQGLGSNAARRLRKQGFVPAVLYGESMESRALVVSKKDIVQILKLESGENTIFKVAVDTDMYDAMIKDLQIDPVTDELLHADLIRISMDKPVRVTVPIVHSGEPVGVKTEGGFVDFVTREVEVECLPRDIPESLSIDISELHIHQSIKAEGMAIPAGVKLITEPATVLVLVSLPHKEEEAFPGEKPEEAVAEESKEPEVIKKERAEKEEAEK